MAALTATDDRSAAGEARYAAPVHTALAVVAVLLVLTAALVIQALFDSPAAAWFILATVLAFVGLRLWLRDA